jgi:hypothetical protein
MHRFVCVGFFFIVVSWTVGCTAKNDPAPPTAKVNGTVSQDGKAMPTGEIRFTVAGQPAKTMEIKDGAFSGEAFVGKNNVDVVLEKDGPPSTTDPTTKTKINAVAPKAPLTVDVAKGGASELKFEVNSIPGK